MACACGLRRGKIARPTSELSIALPTSVADTLFVGEWRSTSFA